METLEVLASEARLSKNIIPSLFSRKLVLLCISFFLVIGLRSPLIAAYVPTDPCDPTKDFTEVYLLPMWDQLPHKCQEESKERIEELKTLSPEKHWKFSESNPVWCCLAFAASTNCDWWALQYGWKLGSYENIFNKQMENGFNPRPMEVAYLTRSAKNRLAYPVLPFDPVHREFIPTMIRGYGKVLTSVTEETLVDPFVPNLKWDFKPGMYPMEDSWFYDKRKMGRTNEYELDLVKALHHFGILMTKIEYDPTFTFLLADHCVSMVGYGKNKEGKIVFIYQDNYGDHPKDFHTTEGKSAYRCCPAKRIESVLGFPHQPVASAIPQGDCYVVEFKNKGGKSIQPNKVSYLNSDGKEVKSILSGGTVSIPKSAAKNGFLDVYVEAEFYMKDLEKGWWQKVPVQ
ncbi:MAG: hypothetical protein HQM08_13735 [Candidatus Riflebacteria bacterium]|nr:hypothetical protein [Candidatus Riflebacteria bacterium]